jgi:hypothetical protein
VPLRAGHKRPATSDHCGRPSPGVDRALEAEYLVALWLLVCVAAAIDRRTIARGRVGLVRDSAVDVDLATLKLLGFRRGRRADGYDGDYYVVET